MLLIINLFECACSYSFFQNKQCMHTIGKCSKPETALFGMNYLSLRFNYIKIRACITILRHNQGYFYQSLKRIKSSILIVRYFFTIDKMSQVAPLSTASSFFNFSCIGQLVIDILRLHLIFSHKLCTYGLKIRSMILIWLFQT